MQVELDQTDCCGSGMCVNLAPAAFEIEPSGMAEVLPSTPTCDRDQPVRAAKSCPTGCITLTENGEKLDRF